MNEGMDGHAGQGGHWKDKRAKAFVYCKLMSVEFLVSRGQDGH